MMKSNELAVIKGCSAKLDDNTLIITAFAYHSEKGDRSKSEYVYFGRVVKIDQLNTEISSMKSAENKDKDWVWPNMDGKIFSYDLFSTQERGARWLEARIKKAVDFDLFLKILDGYKPLKDAYVASAKYDLAGIATPDGTLVDIKNKESLMTLTTFSKTIKPKTTISKTVKAEPKTEPAA